MPNNQLSLTGSTLLLAAAICANLLLYHYRVRPDTNSAPKPSQSREPPKKTQINGLVQPDNYNESLYDTLYTLGSQYLSRSTSFICNAVCSVCNFEVKFSGGDVFRCLDCQLPVICSDCESSLSHDPSHRVLRLGLLKFSHLSLTQGESADTAHADQCPGMNIPDQSLLEHLNDPAFLERYSKKIRGNLDKSYHGNFATLYTSKSPKINYNTSAQMFLYYNSDEVDYCVPQWPLKENSEFRKRFEKTDSNPRSGQRQSNPTQENIISRTAQVLNPRPAQRALTDSSPILSPDISEKSLLLNVPDLLRPHLLPLLSSAASAYLVSGTRMKQAECEALYEVFMRMADIGVFIEKTMIHESQVIPFSEPPDSVQKKHENINPGYKKLEVIYEVKELEAYVRLSSGKNIPQKQTNPGIKLDKTKAQYDGEQDVKIVHFPVKSWNFHIYPGEPFTTSKLPILQIPRYNSASSNFVHTKSEEMRSDDHVLDLMTGSVKDAPVFSGSPTQISDLKYYNLLRLPESRKSLRILWNMIGSQIRKDSKSILTKFKRKRRIIASDSSKPNVEVWPAITNQHFLNLVLPSQLSSRVANDSSITKSETNSTGEEKSSMFLESDEDVDPNSIPKLRTNITAFSSDSAEFSQYLVTLYDTNNDGFIDFSEFVSANAVLFFSPNTVKIAWGLRALLVFFCGSGEQTDLKSPDIKGNLRTPGLCTPAWMYATLRLSQSLKGEPESSLYDSSTRKSNDRSDIHTCSSPVFEIREIINSLRRLLYMYFDISKLVLAQSISIMEENKRARQYLYKAMPSLREMERIKNIGFIDLDEEEFLNLKAVIDEAQRVENEERRNKVNCSSSSQVPETNWPNLTSQKAKSRSTFKVKASFKPDVINKERPKLNIGSQLSQYDPSPKAEGVEAAVTLANTIHIEKLLIQLRDGLTGIIKNPNEFSSSFFSGIQSTPSTDKSHDSRKVQPNSAQDLNISRKTTLLRLAEFMEANVPELGAWIVSCVEMSII